MRGARVGVRLGECCLRWWLMPGWLVLGGRVGGGVAVWLLWVCALWVAVSGR